MINNKLYPIVLFAYNRPWHTEQALQALKYNEFADMSDLTVYVDGPKKNASSEQIKKIEEVRAIVQREQWCKTVNVNFAEKNIGCRDSIINGITEVLKDNETVIVLEDDIVTSPYFLKYMNNALRFYRNMRGVFSVSAYNLPRKILPIPKDYNYDVYVSHRPLIWGWGTWRNRWSNIEWDKSFIPCFLKDRFQVEAFNRGGNDLSRMLLEEYEGRLGTWDVELAYEHFANHAVSIVPCHSYTRNIGFDGSGTHIKEETKIENNLALAIENPDFLKVLYEDRRIINLFFSAFYPKKRPIWKKAINRISRVCGRENVFTVKKRVYR